MNELQKPQADLVPAQPSRQLSAVAEIERSRAVQEVQAALIIAQKFKRDPIETERKILEACSRYSFAKIALYSFPRGGTTVSDVSIRMAEVMAQNWGNIQCGVREVERVDGKSTAESFCWDMETNFKDVRVFDVAHTIDLQGGKKKVLVDERDIYEKIANYGARRKRACILAVIPRHVKDNAVERIRKTLAAGEGEPLIDRIKKCVLAFAALGVNQTMLETRLGHQMDLTTGEELVDFMGIYNVIKDGSAKRGEFFDFPEDDKQGGHAAELGQKLNAKRGGAAPAAQGLDVQAPFDLKNKEQVAMVDLSLQAKKVDAALWDDIKKALVGRPPTKLDDAMKEVFAR